ncbi:MAG: flagellar filament protein FlaA [Treponema sp.]|nr:flagellar filament protein FlaA [Treponema sp.]
MKKGFVVFINLALFFLLCVPVVSQSAQQTQKSVETFIIDRFEGDSDWDWEVTASRYVADDYPKQDYFSGIPSSLKYLRNEGDGDPKVLGIQIAFNRKGDNWFEIYPVKDGKAYEIPFIGTATQIDFWVWGAHYLYYLDVLVRDSDGRVHTLAAGNLAFDGWKNIIVNIPGWIRQHSRLSSGPDSMTFVGFRIRTDPNEFVDLFTIFFDQMKYTTNALAYIFDGYELKEADFGGNSSNSSSRSSGASEGK